MSVQEFLYFIKKNFKRLIKAI